MELLPLLLPITIGVIAYLTKALDKLSASMGIVIGVMIILSQNLNWFLLLLTFLLIGIISTNLQIEEKEDAGLSKKRRKIGNVVGNGLAPLIMALTGNLYGFAAAIATATADTLSSEIGVLSPERPVLITTFEKVKRGAEGGVSRVGTMFMLLGSGIISVSVLILFNDIYLSITTFVLGNVGCMIDSLLGATLERKRIIGNTAVNFFSTLAASLIAIAITMI